MNKFQKIATRLARHEVMMVNFATPYEGCENFGFRQYKNQVMTKFRKEKWQYPKIIEYKNNYIQWDRSFYLLDEL